MCWQPWKAAVTCGVLAGLVGILARHPVAAFAADGQQQGQAVVVSDQEPARPPAAPVAEEAPVAPAPARPADPTESVRAALDGTQWGIEWTPLDGQGKPQKDTVTFAGPKVSSQRLSKAGYPDTNYTLTVQEGQPPVWETMQTKEETGVVFWRGEIHGATMRGVISMHPKEGSPEDFSFSGKQTAGASLTTVTGGPAASPSPASTEAAPAVTPKASETPKKKRKSWFGR